MGQSDKVELEDQHTRVELETWKPKVDLSSWAESLKDEPRDLRDAVEPGTVCWLAGTIHNEGDLRLGRTSGEEETWMLDRTREGRARELLRTREPITLT